MIAGWSQFIPGGKLESIAKCPRIARAETA
jgi:hypothetical protein